MSADSVRWPGLDRACQRVCRKLITPLCHVARECGYAIGVHGSLARDIDLIAVPWVDGVAPPGVLAEKIRSTADHILGWAIYEPERTSQSEEIYQWIMVGEPGRKPHGRLCWSFFLPGGPYIDLSVMSPTGYFYTDTDGMDSLETVKSSMLKL